MKILAVADIHSDKGLLEKIIDMIKKEKPDLVILAGDITFFGEDNIGIFRILKKYCKYILFVPGNHEDLSLAYLWEKRYDAINLHCKFFKIGNIGIIGIGGGNVPIFTVTEEEIEKYLTKLFHYIKDCEKKIVVTHVHPERTFSSRFGKGSEKLYEFIKKFQPDLVIHGHMHEGGGVEEKLGKTTVINVARFPKIIEI